MKKLILMLLAALSALCPASKEQAAPETPKETPVAVQETEAPEVKEVIETPAPETPETVQEYSEPSEVIGDICLDNL